MFNFFKGRKTKLTITLDRPSAIFHLGETVGATVEVKSEKDLRVRSAKARLICSEKYLYTTSSSGDSESGGGSSDTWGDNELFLNEENFLGETVLAASVIHRYSFQMSLPVNALPSCAGEIVRVEWRFMANLDLPWSVDRNSEVKLLIYSLTPDLDVQPREYSGSNTPRTFAQAGW
jgi:hypothetical protein